MGKYSDELMEKTVTSPSNEIIIIDRDYISKEPTYYTVNVRESSSTYEFEILDKDGKECYKCISKAISDTKLVCDSKNQPLILIKEGATSIKLLSEKNDIKEIAKIKFKNSTKAHKYALEYFNIATQKEEVLNLNCSNTYRTNGVFYGREKEGAPMICRICKTPKESIKNLKNQFTIEIAPNVDSLIMIVFALYISLRRQNDFIVNSVVF